MQFKTPRTSFFMFLLPLKKFNTFQSFAFLVRSRIFQHFKIYLSKISLSMIILKILNTGALFETF